MKNWTLVVLFCFMFLLIVCQEGQINYLLDKGVKQESQLLNVEKQIAGLNGDILIDRAYIHIIIGGVSDLQDKVDQDEKVFVAGVEYIKNNDAYIESVMQGVNK